MKSLLNTSNWLTLVIITFFISCAPKSLDEIQEEDPIISEDMDMKIFGLLLEIMTSTIQL